MIALGLNGFAGADHDPAAAVVADDVLVSAVEEERLTRIRHAPGAPPVGAAREALALAGVDARDVQVVAHGWQPGALGSGLTAAEEAERVRRVLRDAGLDLDAGVRVEFVDHHLAHFWSGIPFIPPGHADDRVDGLVLDGAGESTAGAFFRLAGDELTKVWNLGLKGSLGFAYEAATLALGFHRGQEGKTMGLAPYGRPDARAPIPPPPDDRFPGDIPVLADRDELRAQNRSQLLQFRAMVPRGASFNQRADLALGVQSMLEDRVLALLREITDPAPVLVLAGGVALNCTMNGKVAAWCRDNGVTLVVPPPANDAGVAIGAAVAHTNRPGRCRSRIGAALGREFAPELVRDRLAALGARVAERGGEYVVEQVRAGKFCGWFSGPAEIGPRALGRRAILARPDSAALRDRLNVTKGRESWRPLAPSVQEEAYDTAFDGTASAYMLVASRIKPDAYGRLAGVAHVDNSVRPQAVSRVREPRYWELLEQARHATGLACLTCTSFNVAGAPIVYTPEDAWHAANQMGLDLLAGDGWCVDLRPAR